MSLILLSAYFLAIILFGFSALAICENRRDAPSWPLAETLAVSYILGSGMAAFALFWLALLGLPVSRLAICVLLAMSVSLFVFSRRTRPAKAFPVGRRAAGALGAKIASARILLPLALAAISISAGIVILNSLFTPLWDIDSFALWGLKSKALYLASLDKESYFHRPGYGFSHLEYPLLVPFLNAGVYACAGGISQPMGKLLYVPLFVAIAAVFHYSAAARMGRSSALGLCAILISSPALVQWAGAGTADIYVLAFFSLGILSCMRFLETRDKTHFAIAMVSNAALVFTKNEGLVMALANIVLLFAFASAHGMSKAGKLLIALGFSIACVALAPWFIWSADIPRIHENYPKQIANMLNPANLARIPGIASAFLSQTTDISRWGLFWFVAAVSLATPQWRRPSFSFPMASFAALGATYFAIFVISPWSVEYLSASALERLLLHLAVPAYFMMVSLSSMHSGHRKDFQEGGAT